MRVRGTLQPEGPTGEEWKSMCQKWSLSLQAHEYAGTLFNTMLGVNSPQIFSADVVAEAAVGVGVVVTAGLALEVVDMP